MTTMGLKVFEKCLSFTIPLLQVASAWLWYSHGNKSKGNAFVIDDEYISLLSQDLSVVSCFYGGGMNGRK